MANYTSKYTGAQIDQAIGSYLNILNGGIRTYYEADVTSDGWEGDSPYSISITLTGSMNLGTYPDAYFITSDGIKCIPEVQYTTNSSGVNFCTIYSNYKLDGKIVLIGKGEVTS